VFSVKGAATSSQGWLGITSLRGDFKAGKPVRVASIVGIKPKDGDLDCAELGENAVALRTPDPAIAAFGPLSVGGVQSDAEALLLTPDILYAADATAISAGGPLLRSSRPVTLCWDLAKGEMDVEADAETVLMVQLAAGKAGILPMHFGKGRHHFTVVKPAPGVLQAIRPALEAAVAMGKRPDRATPPDNTGTLPTWQQVSKTHLDGAVKWLIPGYAVTDRKAYPLAPAGTAGTPVEAPAEILSATYWPEPHLLLLGCKDDKVYAYDPAGKLAWTFQSVMHDDVRATGKTYWFKDAIPGISGLLTGHLTADGTQAMIGSACTIEVVDAHGQLLKRLPVFWGNVWRMALLTTPDGARKLLST
jgi:hypothetical protein